MQSKKKAEQPLSGEDDRLKASPLPSSGAHLTGKPAQKSDQPQPQPQAQLHPQPSKPTPEDGKKVSIKNLMAETRPPAGTVNEPSEPVSKSVPDNEFTTEELIESWNTFAQSVKEESPRISITLSSVTPGILPDKSIELKLDNSALKETFDHNYKSKLENHLRETLGNAGIKITTVVESTERGDILYSVDQKFNHLVNKNPALKDLKKTFNLDFE
jgi:hypothetical protein